MMKREDIGEKYVDKHLYFLLYNNALRNLLYLSVRNKTTRKVNNGLCIVRQTYYDLLNVQQCQWLFLCVHNAEHMH